MTKDQIIKQLLDMAKHPTVTLPRDCEALKAAADLLAQPKEPLVINSQEKASEFIEKTLWEVIDVAAMFPKAKPDPRTWEHLMVYSPQPKEPEQAPVAWITRGGKGWLRWHKSYDDNKDSIPLYKAPPQRKPLTDEQIMANDVLRYHFALNGGAGPISKQGRKVIDAIEAAHGIKE